MVNETRQALVELWRAAESHAAGKKPSVRMVTRWARELGHRFREDEARQILQSFAGRDAKQMDATGRKKDESGTQRDAVGRNPDATSRARSKVLLVTKNTESNSVTLFGEAEGGRPARSTHSRAGPSVEDLAAYAIRDAAYAVIVEHVPVALSASDWKLRNKRAAAQLVRSGRTTEEVCERLLRAYTDPLSRFYGGIADLDALIRHWAKLEPAKEKTALARGFQEPENFKPRTFERE